MYYTQIKKIESHVIKDHEEYSMIAFHLNAEGEFSEQCLADCNAFCMALQNKKHCATVSNSKQEHDAQNCKADILAMHDLQMLLPFYRNGLSGFCC